MCQSAHETQQQKPKQRFNGYTIRDGGVHREKWLINNKKSIKSQLLFPKKRKKKTTVEHSSKVSTAKHKRKICSISIHSQSDVCTLGEHPQYPQPA